MSLTVSTKPDAKPTTVHRPVDWQLTTTRTGVESYSITNIADNGSGFTRYTIGSHALEANDNVLGAGVSDSAFNINQRITAVAATTIDTDLAFSGSPTGGTVTRANTGVNIRAELLAFDGNLLEVTSISNNGGAPQLNFASAHGLTVDSIFMVNNTGVTAYDKAIDTGEFAVTSTTAITLSNIVYSAGITTTGGSDDSAYVIAASTLIEKNGLNISDVYYFDFAKEMSSKMSEDLTMGKSVLAAYVTPYNDSSVASTSYTVRWTEYIDVDSLQTSMTSIFEDNSSIEWYSLVNGIVQHTETQDFDDYTINIGTVGTVLFLTDVPRTRVIAGESGATVINKRYSVYVDGLESLQLEIEPFDISGASGGVTTAVFNRRAREGLFSFSINDISGAGTIFTSSNKYVDVWLSDTGSSTQQTEKISILIDPSPCVGVDIQFLNKYGVWDSFIFKGALNNTLSVERSSYHKDLSSSFTVDDRGESSLGIEANENYTLYSGGVTEDVADWLKQLIWSKAVFVRDGVNLVPITVTNKTQAIIQGRQMPEIILNYRLSNSLITHG